MTGLRVAMVAFPSPGGSGVVASELAGHLAERGHTVLMFASQQPFRLQPRPGLEFCPVHTSDHPLFNPPSYVWSLAAALTEQHHARPLDVIHVHYAVPHAVGAAVVKQALGNEGPRLVITLHGTDVTEQGKLAGPRAITRWALTNADALTAPSRFLREAAVDIYAPNPEQRFDVIGNFVDLDRYRPEPRDAAPRVFRLLHISNLRPIKRVRDVVAVAARVARELPIELVVVGEGPEREGMQREAERLGISERTRFVGADPDTRRWLAQSHVLLLPSESESFGLVALEAMACGVPVVVSRTGGLPEVVEHDQGGWLASVGDSESMAEHVLRVLGDPALYAQQSKLARAHAERVGRAQPAVDAYERLYVDVCNAGER